jgi:hypothetical protein
VHRTMVTFFVLHTAVACQPATSAPNIEILLYNHAGIPEKVLSRAQVHAAQIFNEAGVGTRWVRCGQLSDEPRQCADPLAAHRLMIQLESSNVPSSMLGSTIPPGDPAAFHQRAIVFRKNVESLAHRHRFDAALLLGGAIAHEVGHLLLQDASHTISGIMTADWRNKQLSGLAQGTVLFSNAQAQRLRLSVLQRVHAATAGHAIAP